MVSGSLKPTSNLLTVQLVIKVAYRIFDSVTLFFGIKVCVFLENKTDLHQLIFGI